MWPMIYPCCVDMLLVTMSDYPSNIDAIMLVDVLDLITGYYHIPVQISLFPTNQLRLIRFRSHHSHFCFHLAKKCESENRRSVFLSDRSNLLSPLEDDIVGGQSDAQCFCLVHAREHMSHLILRSNRMLIVCVFRK
jgi:hypothetical protein